MELPQIELTPVESSVLSGHAYDAPSQTLIVRMKSNDKEYRYADVPQEVYDQMLAAESIGSFYSRNIRGKYQAPSEAPSDSQ